MKRIALSIGLVVLAALGGAGTVNAQGFGVYVGSDDHPYYWRHHHWRGDYAYEPGCRMVVRSHINRFGERVTVRRRICD